MNYYLKIINLLITKMVESGGDEPSIVFTKENINPKVITVNREKEKEKSLNDTYDKNDINNQENKFLQKKYLINIKNTNVIFDKNRKQKINKEEIFQTLDQNKKIEIENLNDTYNNNNYYIQGLTPKNYSLTSARKKNLKLNQNNLFYDRRINPMKINVMKNILLHKEKEKEKEKDNIIEIMGKNKKKYVFTKFDKKLFSKGKNNNYNYNNSYYYSETNKQSDRYSLRNSSSNYNYSEDIKQTDSIRVNIPIEKKKSSNITRNNTIKIERRNSTFLMASIVNMLQSTKSYWSDNTMATIQCDKCLICEKAFSIVNLCCSKCNKHFFCRRCLKNYCRDIIEKGGRRMKCPVTSCKFDIYEEFLSSVLSEDYLKLILYKKENTIKSDGGDDKTIGTENNNKYEIFNKRIKHNFVDKNNKIKMYNNNHVIDINSNIMLYNIKKYKDEFCSKCGEQSLFTKTTTSFHKCLNCGFKICKYCNKEYTKTHLILNSENHCSVYFRFRNDENFLEESTKNFCYNFSLQLLYVLAMFYITYAYCFLVLFLLFKKILKFSKTQKNTTYFVFILKYFLCILFSSLFFVVIFPLIFIWTPYYPSIIALFDGF